MIDTILFDLDGTLLDTAHDITYALNVIRRDRGLANLSLDDIRPYINQGSRGMLQKALDLNQDDTEYETLKNNFLAVYEQHIADSTVFFPEIEALLSLLDQRQINWGIVTNKLTRYTSAVLKALQFEHRPGCVICGDTLQNAKPHPAPILHACDLLNTTPKNCLYIGDAKTDVLAGKAAGTLSLVALYGYIGKEENPNLWGADGYIETASEILNWLK